MKGPRCGELGSKVCRCCGGSHLWNRRAALHSCIRLGTGGDVEDQSNDHASESAILRHRCRRHQGTTDWFCSWWFWRGFLSAPQKQWTCVDVADDVWTHFSAFDVWVMILLCGTAAPETCLATSMYSKYFEINSLSIQRQQIFYTFKSVIIFHWHISILAMRHRFLPTFSLHDIR